MSIAGMSGKKLLELTLGAAVGGLGSKYLAQTLLGGNNSGLMGYFGQAAATLAIAYAAGKVAGADAATGVIAGGGAALAVRIFNDNVSGSSMAAGGAPMSGLGDPDMGRLGIGLGDFKAGMIPMPANWSAVPPPLPAPKKTR